MGNWAKPLQGRLGVRSAIPAELASFRAPTLPDGGTTMRSATQTLIETWIDAAVGFLFCVVLPVPLYAISEPFARFFGATELTIVLTAVAYGFVWYCGRRLDAYPSALLRGKLGYVAPVALVTYAVI